MATSQTVPTSKKMVRPKTFTLKLKTEKKTTTKYLSGINDLLIQLSTKRVTFNNSIIENPSHKTYNYSEIEKVSIRKSGSVNIGIGYGALIGAGVGAIVGLATHKKPKSGQWVINFDFGPGLAAVVGAFIFAIPGIIIGGIRGSRMRKFNISRNKENFEKMRASILEMALSKNGHTAKDSSVNK